MQRVVIDLPENFTFSTEVAVHISYINRADHMANNALVAIMNEAREQFTKKVIGDFLKEKGISWINADLAVIYKSEARHGDLLQVEVTAFGFGRYGCDFVYRITNKTDNKLVALAKTAMLLYDYNGACLIELDDEIKALLQG